MGWGGEAEVSCGKLSSGGSRKLPRRFGVRKEQTRVHFLVRVWRRLGDGVQDSGSESRVQGFRVLVGYHV